ncbi:MAG: SUMF1/EgtB/PvdO family nonheme iron enzyme [Verrucomicrobiota bacterium]
MKHLLFSTAFLTLASLPALAGEIVALCIGNNAYVIPEDQLDTPVNDARLMHQTLCAVPGVLAEDIVLLEDAKRSQITLALRQFKARSAEAKLSLIFYSGHGVEDTPTGYDRAETFLLPVDAVIDNADDLPDRAIPLKTVLESLEGTKGAARAVILDCCRSGAPGATKSLSRAGKSLATLDENVKKALGGAILPEGTLIAFAASPGRKAAAFLKDTDTNSPFTRFISEQMSTQGGDLFSIVNAASRMTKQRTEMRQVPHVELRGDASLITDYTIPAAVASNTGSPRLKPLAELMMDFKKSREAGKDGSPPAPSTGGVLDAGAVGKSVQITLPEEVTMKFCYCPPGSFNMGSPAGEAGRFPDEDQVQVSLSKGFWMAQTEVTQAQWQALMATNLSQFKAAEQPVENVSWDDAQVFLAELNKKVFLLGGWTYVLPTEAQWEYACRAGTETTFSFGNDDSELFRHGNFVGNIYDKLSLDHKGAAGVGERPVTVARHAANPWGLHDMHGNVMEWCSDAYHFQLAGGTDPTGALKGTQRVLRSGAWSSEAPACRAASRRCELPGSRTNTTGLRIAIVPTK